MLTVTEHLSAIDETMLHTGYELVWGLKCRPVRDSFRVENDNISVVP